jgi:myo-inositol 2-dehydrogenase/D-chiro-inositol 1-dehydrogenase
MREITVGILGVGRIGKLHADNLISLPGIRLKSVADPYLEPDEWSSRGIEWAREPERLIDDSDIEAVLICSPTPTHAELIEAAARAGKHIFCEKPIALDPEGQATDRLQPALRSHLRQAATGGCGGRDR